MAHALAVAIKESSEYTSYMEAKERAGTNDELSDALNDFRGKQFEVQKKQMLGESFGPEVMAQMQELAQVLMKDPLAAEFLQAEMRFTLMVNDVYQIIAEAVRTE
jgi:cell fate (sporulation/competence/biofilm development) regulator YlbF (YheA/YmcA/DUF963 family)